jgi:hypothetical protein
VSPFLFLTKGVGYMGKIFGISNLPVSTIESALKVQDTVPKPIVRTVATKQNLADCFTPVACTKKAEKSNPFLKMRNGIGRLMSHFSKAKKG